MIDVRILASDEPPPEQGQSEGAGVRGGRVKTNQLDGVLEPSFVQPHIGRIGRQSGIGAQETNRGDFVRWYTYAISHLIRTCAEQCCCCCNEDLQNSVCACQSVAPRYRTRGGGGGKR